MKKTWGKIVEDLIFEKPRRKSSAQSKNSDGHSEGSASTSGPGFRNRLNSMDEHEKTPGLEEEHKNLSSIIQVDETIEEQDENEENLELSEKKKPSKKKKGKK